MTVFDVKNILSDAPFTYSGYSEEYCSYIEFFCLLSRDEGWTLQNVPHTWAPFCIRLGHNIESRTAHFEQDSWTDWTDLLLKASDKRHALEICATTRPELVQVLAMLDAGTIQWRGAYESSERFVVTSQGSLNRPEIQDYVALLANEAFPVSARCVLVPCSADKPYPTVLHRAVKEVLETAAPGDYYLCVVSGALGLVPEDMWDRAPLYDAGIPNKARITQQVEWYFSLFKHEHVIVYTDSSAAAIEAGMRNIGSAAPPVDYVFGSQCPASYSSPDPAALTSSDDLMRLQMCVRKK